MQRKEKITIQYNRAWNHNRAWPELRFVEWPHYGLRLVGYADEIARKHDSRRIDHTGWFADGFQDRTLRGVVYRLPHGRFIPGYASSDDTPTAPKRNGRHDWLAPRGAALSFKDTTDDELEAARLADQLAESVAESEREYEEAWQAGNTFATLGDEIKAAWKRLKELARERKHARAALCLETRSAAPSELCRAINETAAGLWETITAAREKRDELESYARWQPDAFHDGKLSV